MAVHLSKNVFAQSPVCFGSGSGDKETVTVRRRRQGTTDGPTQRAGK